MKNLNFKKVKGYIEGYYGNLLSWKERCEILDVLAKNDMNFYFYCPKEDINHRYKWRLEYKKKWLRDFEKFIKYAEKQNVNVIVGISPGLDFDYKSYSMGKKEDINLLIQKFEVFLSFNTQYIAILFDDIPDDFNLRVKNEAEGVIHAKIINEIESKLDKSVFSVPRIYSDELVLENEKYLTDFFKTLNKNIQVFYTGKYIVSKNFCSNQKILLQKVKENKIVNWDNFYANDYCPNRLFIGPWKNKNLIEKSMINGTGMIETDKLILEIVNKTALEDDTKLWKNILLNNNIPTLFFNICDYFMSPNFSFEKKMKQFEHSEKTYKAIDFLLWCWKTKLSREWYPYLLRLKHDLQIFDKRLSFSRVLKTQTNPIQNILKQRRNLK